MAHPVLSFRRWTQLHEADYRGAHEAPTHENGDPFHDVTRTIYPDDFYSPEGRRIYGTRDPIPDKESYNAIVSAHNKPESSITIYRAIPASVPEPAQRINPGDWVTPSKSYANEHGARFDDGAKILTKTVPAKHLYTDGNSIHEWGYDPTGLP